MRYVERVAEAEWQHGQHSRQARRIWVVEALKPEMTEQEYTAACLAVRQCSPAFDGMRRAFAERVDGGGSDYGLAAKVTAVRSLEGLRQAAFTRTKASKAPACVEWIVQLYTLPEIASSLGHYRRTGPRELNRMTVDTRTSKPFVRLVLCAMAAYYDDCGVDLQRWSRAA